MHDSRLEYESIVHPHLRVVHVSLKDTNIIDLAYLAPWVGTVTAHACHPRKESRKMATLKHLAAGVASTARTASLHGAGFERDDLLGWLQVYSLERFYGEDTECCSSNSRDMSRRSGV